MIKEGSVEIPWWGPGYRESGSPLVGLNRYACIQDHMQQVWWTQFRATYWILITRQHSVRHLSRFANQVLILRYCSSSGCQCVNGPTSQLFKTVATVIQVNIQTQRVKNLVFLYANHVYCCKYEYYLTLLTISN